MQFHERVEEHGFLGGSDSSLRSSSEQMCPLVIDGINSKQLTYFNGFSNFPNSRIVLIK